MSFVSDFRAMIKRRKGTLQVIGLVIVALVVCAGIFFSIAVMMDRRLTRAYAQIRIGDQRADVDRIMGASFTVLHAGEAYQGEIWTGAWSEARIYANPLLSPVFCARVIFLDAKGQVVSTATMGVQ